MLGHANIATTAIYLKINPEAFGDAAKVHEKKLLDKQGSKNVDIEG